MDSLGPNATATDYYLLGLSYYLSKDYVKAEKNLTELTVRSPTYASGWLYLGKTLAKGDPDVEADPSKAMEFGKADNAFAKYIEIASAEKDATKLANSKLERIATHLYLAYSYITKGNKEGGCAQLDAVLANDPTNKDALDYKVAIGCP
jgi:tetratricopeptide (TPR) repeat protein